MEKPITNCGECKYAEFIRIPQDNIDRNINIYKEGFKCLKGVKDEVVSCPYFEQK